MKLSISTSVFYDSCLLPSESIELISRAGFQYIELNFRNVDGYIKQDVRALAASIERFQLRVVSMHGPYRCDISSLDETERKRAEDSIRRVLELYEPVFSLNKDTVFIIHPGSRISDYTTLPARLESSIKSLEALLPEVRSAGAKPAIENMLAGHVGATPEELGVIFEALPEPRPGFCFDTSHANILRQPHEFLTTVLVATGALLVATHISDNDRRYDQHWLPIVLGKGTINWSECMNSLRMLGYEGPLTLELIKSCDRDWFEYLKLARRSLDELTRA